MLTVKSILTGALVFGAATVPAGVVVTDLATGSIPEAPGAITIEAPDVEPIGLAFQEVYVSAALSPPQPSPVVSVQAPQANVPELAVEEARLHRVSLVRPGESGLERA